MLSISLAILSLSATGLDIAATPVDKIVKILGKRVFLDTPVKYVLPTCFYDRSIQCLRD